MYSYKNNKGFYDVNEVKTAGNVTADLQLKYTSRGKAYVNFSICNHAGRSHTFLHCIAWNQVAQQLASQARKGTKIEITNGRLTHGMKTYTILGANGQSKRVTFKPIEINVKAFKVLQIRSRRSARTTQVQPRQQQRDPFATAQRPASSDPSVRDAEQGFASIFNTRM